MKNRRRNAFILAAYLLMIRRLHFAMGAISVLRELEPRSRHHKPMTMHVGFVGQVGQGEAHHASAVVDNESRFCVAHSRRQLFEPDRIRRVFGMRSRDFTKRSYVNQRQPKQYWHYEPHQLPRIQLHRVPSSREYLFGYRGSV
jgi:hypothetical protein